MQVYKHDQLRVLCSITTIFGEPGSFHQEVLFWPFWSWKRVAWGYRANEVIKNKDFERGGVCSFVGVCILTLYHPKEVETNYQSTCIILACGESMTYNMCKL